MSAPERDGEVKVNPARAGMIPMFIAEYERAAGKPRASGDDPR